LSKASKEEFKTAAIAAKQTRENYSNNGSDKSTKFRYLQQANGSWKLATIENILADFGITTTAIVQYLIAAGLKSLGKTLEGKIIEEFVTAIVLHILDYKNPMADDYLKRCAVENSFCYQLGLGNDWKTAAKTYIESRTP